MPVSSSQDGRGVNRDGDLPPEDFYKACNLRGNPFRSNPIYSSDPRAEIWVGYERQQQQLTRYLERTRGDQVGNANFVMLYGNYGTGKSHALLWAQNLILNAESRAYNSVCYVIPTLKKSKGVLTFAGAFIDDLILRSSLVADVQVVIEILFALVLLDTVTKTTFLMRLQEETIIEKLIPAPELHSFAKLINKTDNSDRVRSLRSCPRGWCKSSVVRALQRIWPVSSGCHGGQLEDRIFAQWSDCFQGHVAGALHGPFVVLLEQQNSADQASDGILIGEDADNVGAALDFAVEPFQRVGAVDLGPVVLGEAHKGEDIGFRLIHQCRQLCDLGPELISNLAPLEAGHFGVLLGEGGGDEGSDDTPALLSGMGQDIAHEMHAAALPGGMPTPLQRPP